MKKKKKMILYCAVILQPNQANIDGSTSRIWSLLPFWVI